MKKLLALFLVLFATEAFAQASRHIQSSDVVGALGYTPLQSIGGMTGPAITCGAGLNCSLNSISATNTIGGISGQIQYNNAGSLAGFTMSGDATLLTSTGVLTLSTVNSNVGSFGSATNCTTFTTNGKGLITAANDTPCTPGITSITGMGTGVGTFLATPSSANLRAAVTDETGTGLLYFQGGDIGTPSAGVGTNLTSLNATALSSGTVAAARGGAGTINGALKGNGSGVVSQAACADLSNGSVGCSSTWPAWSSFTASPNCAAGFTTTVNSAKSYTVGKTTHLQYDVTITAIGSCTSSTMGVSLSTPNTANTGASMAGYDSVGGTLVYCYITPSSTAFTCRSAANMVTNSHFYLSGVYENQ